MNSAGPPYWWRGRTPETDPIPGPMRHTLFVSGPTSEVDVTAAEPHPVTQLRSVSFDHAAVRGAQLDLDGLSLSVTWSEFEDCQFRQRPSRRYPSGYLPQGSFGNRPSVYRRCTFLRVRFTSLTGFIPLSARFEDCVFDRCRFHGLRTYDADFVGCRFLGKVQNVFFFDRERPGARPVDHRDNDYSEAQIIESKWIGIDHAAQRWPAGYLPRS